MKAWFARAGNTLVPADAAAEREVKKLGEGEGMTLQAVRIRSLQWHRLYFGACREIGHNCDPPRDESSIDYELRIRAGHYDVRFIGGVECRIPKRIAFERLTADQWAALWPSLDLAMQEHFGFDIEGWQHAA